MRISTRLTASYALILLLMTVLALYSVNISMDFLQERAGNDTVSLAVVMMKTIRDRIRTTSDHLRAYSRGASVRSALRESNSRLDLLANPEEVVLRRDSEWTSAPEEEMSPLMQEVIESECSTDLRDKFIHFFEDTYGYRIFEEALISDRYGADVCQTGRTTRYYQANEDWWRQARNDGFHLGDIEYDPSSQTYGLPISVRIEDTDGTFLGVAKGFVSLLAIVKAVEISEKRYESTDIRLISGSGRLLYATRAFVFLEDMSGQELFSKTKGESGFFMAEEGGRKRLFSYTRSKDSTDPEQSEWILVLRHDLNEVLGSVVTLRNRMILASAFLLSAAILISALIGRSIRRPLAGLGKAAREVAGGNLNTKVEVTSVDEIGMLAITFNEMTKRLEQLYSKLEEEVIERKTAQSELEALNEELARINEELVHSNKELEDFAYIASHDLREPLRGIRNFSFFLLEDYSDKLDAEGQSKLQTLIRLSKRMEDFIEALLTYSRVGRCELSLKETDLNKVLDHVVDSLGASVAETGASIRIERPLPVVRCDQVRIEQVFNNLIANAIKYNDKPRRWVEVGYIGQEEGIVFYVRDNGIGIKEKHLQAIFKIFKRLHGRDEFGGGAGAGLTIVKKIVEGHGGKIRLESDYGEGTTFYFTLQGDDPPKRKVE